MVNDEKTYFNARKCLQQMITDNKQQYDKETIKALEIAINALIWAEIDYNFVKELSKGLKND